jgi:hypothetical protein
LPRPMERELLYWIFIDALDSINKQWVALQNREAQTAGFQKRSNVKICYGLTSVTTTTSAYRKFISSVVTLYSLLKLLPCPHRRDHHFHNLLVTTYREFARHVWQDLRCLGIIILQIYSLSIFPPDEVEKLMHWPVRQKQFC